jgi:WD40 repeat protein
VNSIAFSPDGKRFAAISFDVLKIWDMATAQEIWSQHADGPTRCIAFNPDGTRIGWGSHDNSVKIWDAATGHQVLTLKGHTEMVNSVAFSRDGKRIASGSQDMTLKVWDAVTGQETLTLKVDASSVVFSPDSKRIAGGRRLQVWNTTMPTMLTAEQRLRRKA